MAKQTPDARIEELAHQKYHKKFNEYVTEIDMNPTAATAGSVAARRVTEKKPKKK